VMVHFDFPFPPSCQTFVSSMLVFQGGFRAVTCIVSNAARWFFRCTEYEPFVSGRPCQQSTV